MICNPFRLFVFSFLLWLLLHLFARLICIHTAPLKGRLVCILPITTLRCIAKGARNGRESPVDSTTGLARMVLPGGFLLFVCYLFMIVLLTCNAVFLILSCVAVSFCRFLLSFDSLSLHCFAPRSPGSIFVCLLVSELYTPLLDSLSICLCSFLFLSSSSSSTRSFQNPGPFLGVPSSPIRILGHACWHVPCGEQEQPPKHTQDSCPRTQIGMCVYVRCDQRDNQPWMDERRHVPTHGRQQPCTITFSFVPTRL